MLIDKGVDVNGVCIFQTTALNQCMHLVLLTTLQQNVAVFGCHVNGIILLVVRHISVYCCIRKVPYTIGIASLESNLAV